jgi:acetyltransferase-like isoleucine patch superfamily enzyme
MLLSALIKVYELFPLESLRTRLKTTLAQKKAILGKATFFHRESTIHNLQTNPKKIVIGSNSHIRGELLVFAHGGEILIGDYCFIGEHSKIWSAANIRIGNYVLIAHNVNIHDNISHPIAPEERRRHTEAIINYGHPKTNLNLKEEPIVIHDDAWIGFNATILKGVTIGKGAIIGACTLITEDVPDFAIVVGNPARIIGYANA